MHLFLWLRQSGTSGQWIRAIYFENLIRKDLTSCFDDVDCHRRTNEFYFYGKRYRGKRPTAHEFVSLIQQNPQKEGTNVQGLVSSIFELNAPRQHQNMETESSSCHGNEYFQRKLRNYHTFLRTRTTKTG